MSSLATNVIPLPLAEELRAEEEINALKAIPYEQDADLSWEAPAGPDLPYDGEIPADVVALSVSSAAAG